MKNEDFTLEHYLEKETKRKERARLASKRYYEKKRNDIAVIGGFSARGKEEMLKEQEGRCAICTVPMKKPCVDHNHETGEIRGLLCPKCNMGLGFFDDDRIILQEAARYLMKFEKDEETAS